MKIEIDYGKVEQTINEVNQKITNNQSNILEKYTSITSVFTQSAGEEADALREQIQAESSLVNKFSETLTILTKNIETTKEHFKNTENEAIQAMKK